MKKFLLLILTFYPLSLAAKSEIAPPLTTTDTELIFILDRSGSMSGLESDTIGGFNAMLEKQKKTQGNAFVTTVLFDNKYELLHKRIPLAQIKPITDKEYFVRGSTALLDAIGKTILQVKQNVPEQKEQATKVLFVIITDGMENASTEFSGQKIKQLIQTQTEKANWEFLFLGANIDAIGTAASFGIDQSKAVEYISDSEGTQKNYEVLSEAIIEVRSGKSLDKSWKKEIEKDVEQRKTK